MLKILKKMTPKEYAELYRDTDRKFKDFERTGRVILDEEEIKALDPRKKKRKRK